jgi:hypothetical protein
LQDNAEALNSLRPQVAELEQLTGKLGERAGLRRQSSLHADLGDMVKRLDNLGAQTSDKIRDLENKNQKWTDFYRQMAALNDDLTAKDAALPKVDSNLLPEERYTIITVCCYF